MPKFYEILKFFFCFLTDTKQCQFVSKKSPYNVGTNIVMRWGVLMAHMWWNIWAQCTQANGRDQTRDPLIGSPARYQWTTPPFPAKLNNYSWRLEPSQYSEMGQLSIVGGGLFTPRTFKTTNATLQAVNKVLSMSRLTLLLQFCQNKKSCNGQLFKYYYLSTVQPIIDHIFTTYLLKKWPY